MPRSKALIVSKHSSKFHDSLDTVVVQTAFSHMEVTKVETLHMVSQGDIVIVRGWLDARCKDTNKSGRLHFTITYVVKDGKIISYDEMTDSGIIPANLVLWLAQRSHQSPGLPAAGLTIEVWMCGALQPLKKPCSPSEGLSPSKHWR